MPPDLQRKVSCHDLKRTVDKFNGLPDSGMTADDLKDWALGKLRQTKLLVDARKLVRWVESNRHIHEEIRDHNGRLKDTGIWASFYSSVRALDSENEISEATEPHNPPQNLKPCCGSSTGECHPTCRHRTHAPSPDRCARLAEMEGDESPFACGPEMIAGLAENAEASRPASEK